MKKKKKSSSKKVIAKKSKEKIIDKKSIVIYVLVALFLVSLSFGLSYAYFTASVTGNDTAKQTKITVGTLDIDFDITDRITNSNIMLIKDADHTTKAESLTFSVSNNGNVSGQYLVYLSDMVISNNLKSADFKWELVKNGTTTYTGNFTTATNGVLFPLTSVTESGSLIPANQVIAVNATDSFVLRIWLSETQEDQSSLLGGSFSAKVKMVSTSVAS